MVEDSIGPELGTLERQENFFAHVVDPMVEEARQIGVSMPALMVHIIEQVSHEA
ncbi:hypothetical protein [Amycolatopsis suaedae]|uniref:hypothetical protein n=1 Tax=Amycolatopsis suaedae TaxID=2510978 RepID=UPI0013EEFE19|nr:hypothetical protein [Amycolatopsis suaedae]